MKKNNKILLALVVILALVFGLVWLIQNPAPDEIDVIDENEDVQDESVVNVYESSDIGYSLVIPDEWNDYGYAIEYETVNIGGYVTERETFTSNFEDWENFELLTIGSIDRDDHYEALAAFDSASEDVSYDFQLLDSFPEYLAIGSVIGENEEKVFFNYYVRQDGPNRYTEDGGPMPNFETDFEIL